jgi:hypothetical protein
MPCPRAIERVSELKRAAQKDDYQKHMEEAITENCIEVNVCPKCSGSLVDQPRGIRFWRRLKTCSSCGVVWRKLSFLDSCLPCNWELEK